MNEVVRGHRNDCATCRSSSEHGARANKVIEGPADQCPSLALPRFLSRGQYQVHCGHGLWGAMFILLRPRLSERP
jgi:hypothetical protein